MKSKRLLMTKIRKVAKRYKVDTRDLYHAIRSEEYRQQRMYMQERFYRELIIDESTDLDAAVRECYKFYATLQQ